MDTGRVDTDNDLCNMGTMQSENLRTVFKQAQSTLQVPDANSRQRVNKHYKHKSVTICNPVYTSSSKLATGDSSRQESRRDSVSKSPLRYADHQKTQYQSPFKSSLSKTPTKQSSRWTPTLSNYFSASKCFNPNTSMTFQSQVNNHHQSFSLQSAAQIFSKLENNSLRITTEIQNNTKAAKEWMQVKKELQQVVENLKVKVVQAEKLKERASEDVPTYQETTVELQHKIHNKKDKAFQHNRDITDHKIQIKKLGDEKVQFQELRLQLKAQIKEEDKTKTLIQKKIAELKLKISQIQKEKEKVNVEVSKQQKIIRNQLERMKTLDENNIKFYDTFRIETKRMQQDSIMDQSTMSATKSHR